MKQDETTKKFPIKGPANFVSPKRSPPMTDDDILKRQPRYGQKGKPIAVVDKVKTRYGNTSDY
jgi:hypothetical protein